MCIADFTSNRSWMLYLSLIIFHWIECIWALLVGMTVLFLKYWPELLNIQESSRFRFSFIMATVIWLSVWVITVERLVQIGSQLSLCTHSALALLGLIEQALCDQGIILGGSLDRILGYRGVSNWSSPLLLAHNLAPWRVLHPMGR